MKRRHEGYPVVLADLVFSLIEELPVGVVDEHEDARLDVLVRLDQRIYVVD